MIGNENKKYERYDDYIRKHKSNIRKAYYWLVENTPRVFNNDKDLITLVGDLVNKHDDSKFNNSEFEGYKLKFRYGANVLDEQQLEYQYALNKHYKNNKHHWEYWIIPSPNENIVLDMPIEYILEMICDWFSFSIEEDELRLIFDWYDKNRYRMQLSDNTREKVEDILRTMYEQMLILKV